MKQLILILIAINIIRAERLYDCNSLNKAIRFDESVQVYRLDTNQQLPFYAVGQVISPIQTDYIQIRVYGDGPEFNILKTERFSYHPYSYSAEAYVRIADFADCNGLGNEQYKVQIDVIDAYDKNVGCAAFFVSQDRSMVQE